MNSQSQMAERIVRKRVTFARPFFLEDLAGEQPAGTYEVETIEEMIEGLSFLAYRTVATSIVLPLSGGAHSYQLVRIEPSVVRAAQREADNAGALDSLT